MRWSTRRTAAAAAVLGLGTSLLLVAPAAEAAAPTCAGKKATIVGNKKSNTINGTAGRDVIVAGKGNDVIRAGGGNDIICAGEGADRIYGAGGDDIIYGGFDQYRVDRFGRVHKTGDKIFPGAGNDTVDPGYDARPATVGLRAPDTISYADAPAAAVVDFRSRPSVLNANGTDTISVAAGSGIGFVGTRFNDVIRGTYQDDRILGRGGDDQIFGQAGRDVINADSGTFGSDLVEGGSGADRIVSTDGADTLVGNQGSDLITASSVYRSTIKGGPGGDTVVYALAAEGEFRVDGGSGRDKLRLMPYPNPGLRPKVRIDQKKGKTTVRKLAPVTLTGKVQRFADVVLPAGTDSIYKGTNKGETITANAGEGATIKARGGADVITGSNEKDRIIGGRGFDIAFARGGKDTCKKVERRHSC